MGEINYLNFDIVIQRAGDGYRAQVQSPAGEASCPFTNPFSQLEVEHFMLSAAPGKRSVRRIDAPEVAAAKKFGERLYSSVFAGDVGSVLRSSLDEAWHRNAKLRVRLRLSDAPELADLPWEYLYNPSLNRFLALDDDTAIVRYLDVPERVRPVTVTLPLRVLVMISAPNDYEQLDVQHEWEGLNEALADLRRNGIVELHLLEDATLSALRKQLQKEQYHIFHFIGHGGFDKQTEEGVLVLRDEAGRGRFVSGQQLGWLLHNHHTLALAILNACEGARADRKDAFAGTGQSLVQQGIPAVIAMQFEITDNAAKTFAYGFYSALALGYPVEAALTDTRLTLFSEDHGLEWGTPVLYMRAAEGRLFNIEQQTDLARRQSRITELYVAAQAAMAAQDWSNAAAQWQAILEIDRGHVHAQAGLQEIRKQQELAALYAAGRTHYEAGRWQEAVDALGRVQAIDPAYRDSAAYLGDAGMRMEEARRAAQAQQAQHATPVHGMPAVDTRGAQGQGGQAANTQPNQWQQTNTTNPAVPWNQQQQGQLQQQGGGDGTRGAFVGPVPAPVPAPRRRAGWIVPALLVGLLVVFGIAAFAFLSARQAEEQRANATATANTAAANSRSTATARAEARETASARSTATQEELDFIISVNATSTAIAEEASAAAATETALASLTSTTNASGDRKVIIERLETAFDTYVGDVRGMTIKVFFTADNLKDVQCSANAYFYWKDGTKILSLDGTYQDPSNNVGVRQDFKPGYDAAVYDGLEIFMPYAELEMDFLAGTYDLKYHVLIFDENNVELARSEFSNFSYTSPGPGPAPTPAQ